MRFIYVQCRPAAVNPTLWKFLRTKLVGNFSAIDSVYFDRTPVKTITFLSIEFLFNCKAVTITYAIVNNCWHEGEHWSRVSDRLSLFLGKQLMLKSFVAVLAIGNTFKWNASLIGALHEPAGEKEERRRECINIPRYGLNVNSFFLFFRTLNYTLCIPIDPRVRPCMPFDK